MQKALSQCFGVRVLARDEKKIFRLLTEGFTPKETCLWLGCSAASFSRWQSGLARIPLFIILALLEKLGRLYSFLDLIVDLEYKVPSMREIQKAQNKASEVFLKFPEAAALLCCCDLRAYADKKNHRPGFFSRKLGITIEREKQIVEHLLEAGLAAKEKGKLIPQTYFTNVSWTSEESFERAMKLRTYWWEIGLEAYRRNSFSDRRCTGGYEVFSIPEEKVNLVRKEIAAMTRRIHRILEDLPDQKTDEVFVMQYQLAKLVSGSD